jgi:hypothetical protein
MAPKSLHILLAENKEAGKILAELRCSAGRRRILREFRNTDQEGNYADHRKQDRP